MSIQHEENPYARPCSSQTARPVRWVLQVRRTKASVWVEHTTLAYEKVGPMREQIEQFNREHTFPQYRIVTR